MAFPAVAVPCGVHMCLLPHTCQPIVIFPETSVLDSLDAITICAWELGEARRQGTTGYNLKLSFRFNKRPKVQLCCFNSYQQPLIAFLSPSDIQRFSQSLPVLCRRPSVSIQLYNYILYVQPIKLLFTLTEC